MHLHGLTVKRSQLKAKRLSTNAKPRPEKVCQWWGTDMTKVLTASGWVYIVFVLDWFSKKIVAMTWGIKAVQRTG